MPPHRYTYRAKYFSTLLPENLRKTIYEVCSKCIAWQFLKQNKNQCGKFPPKKSETKPRDTMCVDFIGKQIPNHTIGR